MACKGSSRTFYVFAANYLLVTAVVAVLCSDMCGVPPWYPTRVHPPITPDGELQYVSEHIMRCKYSSDAQWRAVPWLMVYAFMVMVLQATHTWVCLHRIEALQIARLQSAGGAPPRVGWHALFVVVSLTTLGGLITVVHCDHDYVPQYPADTGMVVWRDRSMYHGAGVGALVTGFFFVHMLVLYTYLMRVKSHHDFRHMCAGQMGGPEDLVVIVVMPRVRRGVYIGSQATLFAWCCVFGGLWYFRVALVVLSEYVLLVFFLVVSLVNLALSRRIWVAYRME